MKHEITLIVNGEAHEVQVDPGDLLLDVLRDRLGFMGAKKGCGTGDCGACTVIVDGRVVTACLVLAVAACGRSIDTIEGLAEGEVLHPLQRSFIDHGAVQCGYCTPGLLMSAKALLEENPDPTEEEIRAGIAGNLCRCTGYVKIVDAIKAASETMRGGG